MIPLEKRQLETIHWKETEGKGGNLFSLKPKPAMLLPEGTVVLRAFREPGRAWGKEKETEWFYVTYDESYVTEWLYQNVVSCFPGITHVQMREMFTQALKLRKTRDEARQGDKE